MPPAALYETFQPAKARSILDRVELHFTPKHGSWLNMAEIELSVLRRQCLNGYIPNRDFLASETLAWETERNASRATVEWQFTTADAQIKLKNSIRSFIMTIICKNPHPSKHDLETTVLSIEKWAI